MRRLEVAIPINGSRYAASVEPRCTLADFIREEAGLTGTHVGCEAGSCGACTVQVDDVPVRSCLMLAVQADGHEVLTIEGLGGRGGGPHPLVRQFDRAGALQCGFCTPGFLMAAEALIREGELGADESEVREALAGNLCRCTGYGPIVGACREADAEFRANGGWKE